MSMHRQNDLLCNQGLDEVSLLSMVLLQNAHRTENSDAVHVRHNDDSHINAHHTENSVAVHVHHNNDPHINARHAENSDAVHVRHNDDPHINARHAENSDTVHVHHNDDPHINDSFPVINPTLTHDFLEPPTEFLSAASDQHNIDNDGFAKVTHSVTGGAMDAQSVGSGTTIDALKIGAFSTTTGEGVVLVSSPHKLIVIPGEKTWEWMCLS